MSSHYPRQRALAILAAGLTFALPARADNPPSVTTAPYAGGVFHLVINASQTPVPASPFIVAPSDSVPPPPVPANMGPGNLTGAGQTLTLKSGQGKSLLTLQSVTASGTSITIVFTHDPADRYYGSGNDNMSKSGPLVHTAGQQFIANGVTRVPFIWSPSGYGILVANDVQGLEKNIDGSDHDLNKKSDLKNHIDWADSNGVLTWTVPDTYADLYLMAAPGMYGVLGQFSRLTGSAPIPPRWTFGYLLSHWGYQDSADVQDKWHQFRDRKIPIDGFIYDYDWFLNDWEFNTKYFPDPAANLAAMHAMNLHFVGIRKPRLNRAHDPSAKDQESHYQYAKDQGWLLNMHQSDLRFDLPAARAWWWGHQLPLLKTGVDGWWNDEAESAYDEFFFMSKGQYEGGRASTTHRQWSLDRSFAPGIQHYGAAVWTGDIGSKWKDLDEQTGTMLNWSMAGMPYVSQDTGGFWGKSDPELYTRWIQTSTFIPVMRSHSYHNVARWPWAFGDQALAAITKVIDLRYRLIPYIYTQAEAVRRTGAPLMRPLVMEFPDDPKTWDLKDEWLVGDRLLAAPVLSPSGLRQVYLPAGGWFDGNTGKAVAGGQTLDLSPVPLDVVPFYVRAGSILPLGPVKQSTAEPEDPLDLCVYPGADAAFTLYEDEGDNYDYEKGAFTRIPMHWDDQKRILTIGPRQGSFPGMLATRHLHVLLPGAPAKQATYTGESISIGF